MKAIANFTSDYRKLLFFIVTALYLSVLIAHLYTRAPWVDEAYVANPAWNLANHGFMGTTCIEMTGSGWTHVDRRTYNTFPVGIIALALIYKVFGFSLVMTRVPSLLWAFLTLTSIFVFTRALGASRTLAAASVILLAADYNFMMAATFGRLDMMCAALGFAALALYATFRLNRPVFAVFASCSLATLSLFTHPNGILFPPALLIVEILGFSKRLSWRVALLSLLPFAIGAGCWFLYASQDWQAAVDQLRSNTQPGRLTGFLHPLSSIRDELIFRYFTSFGLTLGEHPSGPVRARGVILVAYWGATASILCLRQLRNLRYARITLALLALDTIYFTFFEGTRFSYYIVLVTPLYAILLATVFVHLWGKNLKRTVMVAALGLIGLQLGGVVYRSAQNPIRNSFLPAVAFLKRHASPKDFVLAGSDFGFGYGFDRNVKEEITLGYRSGADPAYIVVDPNMSGNMASWKLREPAIYSFMSRKLAAYSKIYDAAGYQIYQKTRNTVATLR